MIDWYDSQRYRAVRSRRTLARERRVAQEQDLCAAVVTEMLQEVLKTDEISST